MLSGIDRVQGWKFHLNLLMVSARDYFGLDDLLHLESISNWLYNSGLLASTYLKIIGLKVHHSIGREFFQTRGQTPRLNSYKKEPHTGEARENMQTKTTSFITRISMALVNKNLFYLQSDYTVCYDRNFNVIRALKWPQPTIDCLSVDPNDDMRGVSE